MEGLLGAPMTVDQSTYPLERRPDRLIHRWLAFLFFAMLGLLAILYLASAAFAV